MDFVTAFKSKQVSGIIKEQGEIVITALLMKLINETIKLIPSSISVSEIKNTAQILTRKYWMWRMNEFIIMFRDGSTQSFGRDGRGNGQLTTKDIFTWADLHHQRRWDEIESIKQRQHQDKKFVQPLKEWHPRVLEETKKVAEQEVPRHHIGISHILRDLMPAQKGFNKSALK